MATLKQGGGANQPLQVWDGGFEFFDVTFTVGAENANASDAIDVTIQLVPRNGTKLIKKPLALEVWCGADGGAVTALASAVMTAFAAGALLGTQINIMTAARVLKVATDANGQVSVRVTEAAGAHNRFLFVQMPDGRVIASPQLTWA